jgi:hypothetical protein
MTKELIKQIESICQKYTETTDVEITDIRISTFAKSADAIKYQVELSTKIK